MKAENSTKRDHGAQTSTAAQRALAVALEKLLQPVCYLFIHERVPFQVLSNIARRTFVRTAYDHFTLEGRTQTKSRVAMLTGITRTEVNQIMTERSTSPSLLREGRSRPAAVLEGWYRDPMFQDDDGNPRPLPPKGKGRTFESLVRKYGADVPARTLLDELERAGLLEYDADGRALPLSKKYLPQTGAAPEIIQCLGNAGHRLMSTVAHNVVRDHSDDDDDDPAFFQREVLSRALPPERLQEFRQELRELLDRYFEETTQYLDRVEELPPQEGYHATGGVGFYYFEE